MACSVSQRNIEEHCCDGRSLPIDMYLQVGSGIGKAILAIGESPAGNGWRKSGRAFFTLDGNMVPTGKNFLVNLQQINPGLNLENISFTEIAKCYVANNRNLLEKCASATWSHFVEQVQYVNPKLIVILGKRTTEIFNKLAGVSLGVGTIGQARIGQTAYSVLPIFHPSPLNPKRNHNRQIFEDNMQNIYSVLGFDSLGED